MKRIVLNLASTVVLIVFILFAVACTESGKASNSSKSSPLSSPPSSSILSKSPYDYITSNAPLPTRYFNVTVNRVSIRDWVNTGNQFADLKAEDGIQYVIINITFKNTSNESRTIIDGEVLIKYNGRLYTFDKSENIMLDGWGLKRDQINPLTTKTTNIVYKVPAEMNGHLFYRPGYAGIDDLIHLGPIK